MKHFIACLAILISTITCAYAQTSREVRGTVVDSAKLSLPGSTIKLTSDLNDNVTAIANGDGKFAFAGVKGNKLTLTISSIGFVTTIKHYTLEADGQPADLGNIVLTAEARQLNAVTIVGVNPVTIKEDTVDYKVSAYKVRENAPIEDVLKKVPGVDVDPNTGAVTAQGQQVNKVRINGKDYMGGDVTSLTRNLPADLAESIQVIDDYGDQANLTGIKTGEPNKVLNIVIRKDKNYGYSLQATAGEGSDALPKPQSNDNRYLGTVNLFKFKGDQQLSFMGNLNNTNVNTFSFGGTSSRGGYSGSSGGFSGSSRSGGSRSFGSRSTAGGITNNQNGITNARSIGTNFRDQWGKSVSVYGSYSFADNDTYTNTITRQVNKTSNPSTQNQTSTDNVNSINHRFNFNIEYKPDTANYLKIVPNINYSKSLTNSFDDVVFRRAASTTAYTSSTYANASSPDLGISALYNRRLSNRGRNVSLYVNLGTSRNDQSQNPIYNYTQGFLPRGSALNQLVVTNSRSNTLSTSLSYIEPLGKISYLEFNYTYNNTYTTSDKVTDTLAAGNVYNFYPLLSNSYNFSFITNRVGLNYRVVAPKYNYTLGLGVLPSTLNGHSATTGQATHVTTVNFAPMARFVYNFSRSHALSFYYNGNSSQPSFDQLQPVTDFSNALYPVRGNPNLKPEFNNTLSIRYNKFSFQTGNILFTNLSFTQTNNKISTNVTTIPQSAALAASPTYRNLQNTNLTEYVNTSGYYSANGFIAYAKPWAERKYTLYFNGAANYTNNVGFIGSVDSVTTQLNTQKNTARTFIVTPGARFRVDLTDIIDAQILANYSINRTKNTINNSLTQRDANVRSLTLGINGKNYFWKNWTLSYDFSHVTNYGYTVPVTNPNILNAYVERRFLKNNAATIRATAFDIFNQNRGYSFTSTSATDTETNTNRLGRYFLLTFTLRLQKFAGRTPAGSDREHGERGSREPREGSSRGPGSGGPGGPNMID